MNGQALEGTKAALEETKAAEMTDRQTVAARTRAFNLLIHGLKRTPATEKPKSKNCHLIDMHSSIARKDTGSDVEALTMGWRTSRMRRITVA